MTTTHSKSPDGYQAPGYKSRVILGLLAAICLAGCGDGKTSVPRARGGAFSRLNDDDDKKAERHFPTTNGSGDPAVTASEPAESSGKTQPSANRLPEKTNVAHSTAGETSSADVVPVQHRPPSRRPQGRPQAGLQIDCGGRMQSPQVLLRKAQGMAGSKTVWILTTSQDERRPQFPALFFRFETPAEMDKELAGQRFQGTLILQQSESSAIYFNSPGSMIEIEFLSVDANTADGVFAESFVGSTDGGRKVAFSGEFSAIRGDFTRQ